MQTEDVAVTRSTYNVGSSRAARLEQEITTAATDLVAHGAILYRITERCCALQFQCATQEQQQQQQQQQQHLVWVLLPETYPLTAPLVQYRTSIVHPDVDERGFVCLNEWCPALRLTHVALHTMLLANESRT